MFPVLIHPDLYRRLRESGRSALGGVWKALRRLRDGHWGGGTRVKRLRGVGRPVYEARTDSGGRLLFTMARSPLPPETGAPGRTACHVQVWDWVEHDDAERIARRNRSPEAEFLELEAVEQFEIDEPPPYPEATFAETSAGDTSGMAEPLLHFLLPPDELEIRSEEPPGVRWYLLEPGVLAEEEELLRLFDRGGDELELKLTREQYEIVQTPGPVLLAGSAGSGKTTVSIHRLALALTVGPANGELRSPSALYLSYSPALVEHARHLVHDLAAARGIDLDAPGGGIRKPDFFTFGDLYGSLLRNQEPVRPMTEALFREWFRKSGRSLDPALVWEELRSILKGACLDTTQPMLDEAAYQELGRKRAPLFVDERPEIYRIAQRYQEWLAEEGRVDRIDLCRRAFAELKRGKGRTWDVVICDEVQDLTELEVAFVFALSRRPDLSGVLLTGDTQQTVQPSGFRWAEVRRLAGKAAERGDRKREAPAVLRLRRNLRSVRPLVEMGNALLLLRREVYGRTEEDEPEEASVDGPVPIEVPGSEEDVLAAIEGFGPRCAVLTMDEAEAERLRQRLGTSRVFHVRDAKGLEFEDVVLWKLLGPDRDLVERFVRSRRSHHPEARLDREPRFKRLLQHLYVAVTRARRHLAIHEGPEPHPFWADERFRGLFEREAVESLAHLFRPTASPAEWEAEGGYFLQRRRFRQAAECYRRAGRPEKETEALAHADEEREDWTGALTRWTGLGSAARQAPLLERLGRMAEAAARYRESGQEADASRCDARLQEERKSWKAAADLWETLGRHSDAARCWERAGDDRRANRASARAAEEAGEPGRAGAFWLEAGELHDLDAAVRCFRAAGEPAKAALVLARQHEAAGRWSRAAAAWRLAGRPRNTQSCRARALEAAGRPDRAAVYRERLGETERAVDLYVQAERWLDVARLEPVQPEGRRRLIPTLRSMIEAGDLESLDRADLLLQTRRQTLRDRLPAIPWFLLTEGERLIWEELRDLERLEHRSRALRAETERAWSRAARHWDQAEEPARAAEVRGGRRRLHLRRQDAGPASHGRGPEAHPSRELLHLLVQGMAPAREVREAVRHLLQGCASCSREIEQARRTETLAPASYDDAIQRLRRKIAEGGLEALREPDSPRALYAELLAHEAVEGLAQVHSTRRYASLALCELLLQKSRELGISDPIRAKKAAEIAVRIAEQLDMDLYGAPVVQDLRAVAWAYLAESRRVQAEVGLAESAMDKAERILEDGSGDPLTQAELLTLKASLTGYCGRFEEALGLLNRAAAVYRHVGERHLLGRTLLKKGTILGNAGQHPAALRLIRRSIDLIDPAREPRLIVCATHNLIWFLHESGREGEVSACLDGARRLYEKAGDRRHLNRLRWLEGKLANGSREAEGALLAAREGLEKEGLAYEAALAAMDLAVLYVQEQREADMRRLADQIYPLFRSDDMYQETTAALLSFQQPAGTEDIARLLDELSGWVARTRSEKNPPALVLPV